MQNEFKDEWLNRAFRLAFFIHNDRETAKLIAVRAMNKLETASSAQFKRYYYRPTGRTENLRATRSRVSLNDLQLLQRLVFVESENFEKEKEQQGKVREADLVKHFIKHLIRISLKRNSFYVTLGISRILHNYATNDAMEIYNIVVQDPERVHDDYYYRSRKGVLMKELKKRFGSLIKTVKVNRGEERFDRRESDEETLKAAEKCLKAFTPWESICAIPEEFDPFEDIIKPFYFDREDPDEEHRIELNRIHAALHPVCFERLIEALALPPSEEKMEIPKFMIADKQTTDDTTNRQNPPDLGADELQEIKDILTAQAESRRAFSANLLRVAVDGQTRTEIDPAENGKQKLKLNLDETAELIEVYAVDENGEILLAAHLLNFAELEKADGQTKNFLFENGREISLKLLSEKDEYGEISGISCEVRLKGFRAEEIVSESAPPAKNPLLGWLENLNRGLKPVLAFGLVLLMLSAVWLIYRQFAESSIPENVVENDKPPVREENPGGRVPQSSPESPGEKKLPAEKNLPPENPGENRKPLRENNAEPKERIKKTEPKKEKEATPRPKRNAGQNLTPPEALQANDPRRKPGRPVRPSAENHILRLPIRGTGNNFDDPENTTRDPVRRGKPLAEISRLYLEITGDADFGRQIGEQISDEFLKNKAFSSVPPETAEGRLIIHVRRESDAKQPEEGTVTAIVLLVNEEGFAVYPNRKGVMKWKYVGRAVNLPARIVRDLIRTKNSGQ